MPTPQVIITAPEAGRYDFSPVRLEWEAVTSVVTVEVSPSSAPLVVGSTLQLVATARDAAGEIVLDPIEWSTSDPSVAAVDEEGLVTAVGEGSAAIRATATSGAFGESAVSVALPELVVTLTDGGIDVVGYYTDFSAEPAGVALSGWTPDVGSEGRWKVVANAGVNVLRMKHPTALGGSFQTNLNFTQAGNVTGDVELFFTATSAQDNEAIRAKAWRDLASNNLSVGGQLRMFGDMLAVLRNGALAAQSAANSMPMVPGGKYSLVVRIVGNTVSLKGWQQGTAEPTSWGLVHTITPLATNTGLLALEASVMNGSSSIIDYLEFSYALGGASAPRGYPAPGWHVPPTGYSVRLTDIPAGWRVAADGVETSVAGGVAVITRSSAPSTIEFLDADGDVLETLAAPTNHRSYVVSASYE